MTLETGLNQPGAVETENLTPIEAKQKELDEVNEKLNTATKRLTEILAKGKENLSGTDALEIRALVGVSSGQRLMQGEALGPKGVGPDAIGGEIRELNENRAEIVKQLKALTSKENGEESPEAQRERPTNLLKRAVGLLYAENGKLRGAQAVEGIRKAVGNGWERMKKTFGFGKKETSDEAFAEETVGDNELATEDEVSTWEAIKAHVKNSRTEVPAKIRELLKGGLENSKELAKLLATDKNARDQAAALGVNILLRVTGTGILIPVLVKAIVENRKINRAEANGELGKYVQESYQTATNRETYRAGQAKEQAVDQADVQERQQLIQEFAQLADALKVAEGKYRWKKGIAEGKGIKKEETRTHYRNDILPPLADAVKAANEKYDAFINSEKGARLIELEEKIGTSTEVQADNEEKTATRAAKALSIVGRAIRGGADILSLYANVGKKIAIDAQGAGNTVDAFVKKSVEGDQVSPEAALKVLAGVDALAEKLNPESIMDRVKKKDKTLLADINQFNELLAALIDLGIIGDVIPRNIGHKQINGVLKKLPFLNRMAGQEGLFREAGFVAKLREKALAQAAIVAKGLNSDSIKWDQMVRGVRNGLDDLAEMGGMNADKYRASRERDMAGALRNADLFGMAANGATVQAVQHFGEARRSFDQIQEMRAHETQIAHAAHSPGADFNNRNMSSGNPATEAMSPSRPDGRAGNPDSPDRIGYTDRRDAVQIDTNQRVDYTTPKGTLMYNENGQPVGLRADGTVTTDYAAANMITPDNPGGTLDGRLYADLANFNIDTHNAPRGLVNYVLRPLAREMGYGTFTEAELKVAAQMYTDNPALFQENGDPNAINAIANAISAIRRSS